MRDLVICFIKYPQPGHVKTRLGKDLGEVGAAAFYSAIAERVITEIYPLSERYELILCTEPTHNLEEFQSWIGDNWTFWIQNGEDLGQRLANAAETAFFEGFERVIFIGTDCIGMDETFIENAFHKLDGHDVVLGPSSDGGYYLLGIREPSRWIFENITWSSEKVLEETVAQIENQNCQHHLLEEKLDVDTLEDLIQFREDLPEEHFLAKKIDHIVSDRLAPPEHLLS